jgi:hypothetical protein
MEQENSLVQRTAARGMIFNINSTSFHRDQCSGTGPRDHLPTCASQRSSTVVTSHANRNTTNENSHEDVRTSRLFVLCMWLYWMSHRGTLGNIPDFNCTAWIHVNRCLYRAVRVPLTLKDLVIHTLECMVFQYSDSTINDCLLEKSGHITYRRWNYFSLLQTGPAFHRIKVLGEVNFRTGGKATWACFWPLTYSHCRS